MVQLLFPPFYRWENCGLEKIRDLPKVTQLISAEARLQTQNCLAAKPVLSTSVSTSLECSWCCDQFLPSLRQQARRASRDCTANDNASLRRENRARVPLWVSIWVILHLLTWWQGRACLWNLHLPMALSSLASPHWPPSSSLKRPLETIQGNRAG